MAKKDTYVVTSEGKKSKLSNSKLWTSSIDLSKEQTQEVLKQVHEILPKLVAIKDAKKD